MGRGSHHWAFPEKWWLEDYFLIGKVTFQGRAVKLREGIIPKHQQTAATSTATRIPPKICEFRKGDPAEVRGARGLRNHVLSDPMEDRKSQGCGDLFFG